MYTEYKDLLIKHGHESMIKPMAIREHLVDYLRANPLKPEDDLDLNPHLHIDYICDRVCERMSNDEKMLATKEEVLLIWLTHMIYSPFMIKPLKMNCVDHSCASCVDCENYMNDLAEGREHTCLKK